MGESTDFCFPITGTLSQTGACPLDHRVKTKFYHMKSSCFRLLLGSAKGLSARTHRAPKNYESNHLNSGEMGGPPPVWGRPPGTGYRLIMSSLIPIFGFRPTKGDRARGDLRHYSANSACAGLAPVKLISRGRVTASVNEFAAAGALCHFFKCDHRRPIRPYRRTRRKRNLPRWFPNPLPMWNITRLEVKHLYSGQLQVCSITTCLCALWRNL